MEHKNFENNFGLESQVDYGWIFEGLSGESAVKVAERVFFEWLLWVTGYQQRETIQAEMEGRKMAYAYSQELADIANKLPELEIARRAEWVNQHRQPDRREADFQERQDALVARMRELDKEQALDFLTEVFVGWASNQQEGSETVLQLGKIIYYAA